MQRQSIKTKQFSNKIKLLISKLNLLMKVWLSMVQIQPCKRTYKRSTQGVHTSVKGIFFWCPVDDPDHSQNLL